MGADYSHVLRVFSRKAACTVSARIASHKEIKFWLDLAKVVLSSSCLLELRLLKKVQADSWHCYTRKDCSCVAGALKKRTLHRGVGFISSKVASHRVLSCLARQATSSITAAPPLDPATSIVPEATSDYLLTPRSLPLAYQCLMILTFVLLQGIEGSCKTEC